MTNLAVPVQNEALARLKTQIEELTEELQRRRQSEQELRESLCRQAVQQFVLTQLVEASAMLTGDVDPPAVLDAVLSHSQRLLPADAHSIWRRNPRTGRWDMVTSAGLSDEYKHGARLVPETSQGMPDVPIIADDVSTLPILDIRLRAYRAEGICSMLSVPLRMHGRVCGTLVFYHRRPHHFTETEVALATIVGHLSAAAMAAADLFAEQARLENRFTRFMQHLPGLAWIKDLDGRYVYANDAAARVFERPCEALYGKTDDEVFPPETAARFKQNDERALDAPAGVQVVEALRQSDGATHYSIVSKFPIPDHAGQPALVGGMAIDITDRKRAEDDARFLASASAALAGLVDYESTLQNVARLAVPTFADWCAVDMLDADGCLRRLAVAHVDPAKVELAHELHRRYPPDRASGKGAWRIIRGGRSELVSEITDDLLVAGIQEPEQLSIIRALGLRSYMGVPLLLRGRVLGVMTFIAAESGRRYDANDLVLAEDLAHRAAIAVENATLYSALKEGDRRKDEFLALLGHELRNPLAPISNSLNVLKLPTADPAMAAQARETIERQIEHLVRLVDDLLDVSRIMRGKVELRRENIDLAAVVARAIETSQPVIDADGHKLTVSLATGPLWIHGDLVRLAQVVSNLLNNAAKYTERGGQICLSVAQELNEAVIRVRDTGIGIAPDALPRLFDMFYQAERRTRHSQGGLGIGLALVRGLVMLHGGGIEARSAGLGTGSEFIVRLPLLPRQDAPCAKHHGDSAAAGPCLPRRRIFVIDDNIDAADSLAMLLRLEGQEASAFYDGPTALAQAASATPDIALIDLGMPKMDGYELARAFRSHPELRRVTLAALTGWGQPEDRQRTAAAGFDHHLVKPVDLKMLRELLEKPCRSGFPA